MFVLMWPFIMIADEGALSILKSVWANFILVIAVVFPTWPLGVLNELSGFR